MEAQGNSQFNPNHWDHHPPPFPPYPHPQPHHPPNFDWPTGESPGNNYHRQHHRHNRRRDLFHDGDFHGGSNENFSHFDAPPEESFIGNGCGGHGHSRPNFGRKRKFDCTDGGSYAKLYVGPVPRTVTEEEVQCLFEEHGNVVEVVLLNDKRTGQRQEYCFVKYASVEEADRAIAALHNHFTLPGAMAPIKVKYADGERKRLGLLQRGSSFSRSGLRQHDQTFSGPVSAGAVQHKVYVNGLNKDATKKEIEEIFSSYGVVTEVFILRDEMKQNRGCGFVGFTNVYMAVAAINGLNGTYVMRGCDWPLVVRCADPKKPKNGEFRPAPISADLRGDDLPNTSHQGNSYASTQESATDTHAGIVIPVANQLHRPASSEMNQHFHQQPCSSSELSQMSLQQTQTLQAGSQSSRETCFQLQRPLHLKCAPNGNIEHQHDCQSPQPCRDDVELNSVALPSEPSCALHGSNLSVFPVECDWSEHICPDGYKYYFNCLTYESRWEKPEDFALYEQELKRQQLQNRSCQEPDPSGEEDCQIQAAGHQRQSCDLEESHLQMSCAMEHSHEQVQVETTRLGEPAFV